MANEEVRGRMKNSCVLNKRANVESKLISVIRTSSLVKVIKILSSGSDLGNVLLHDTFNLEHIMQNMTRK